MEYLEIIAMNTDQQAAPLIFAQPGLTAIEALGHAVQTYKDKGIILGWSTQAVPATSTGQPAGKWPWPEKYNHLLADPELADYLRSGEKIRMVRCIRKATDCGLKEAKAVADSLLNLVDALAEVF